jgi:Spy/CpxP family protein refolding chaperone
MKRPILIILSAVLCTALVSTATAKPRFAGPLADRAGELRAELAQLAEEFDLSDEQKAEIKAIVRSSLLEAAPALGQMVDNREAINAAIAAETVDQALIESVAGDQASLFTELARIRAEAFVAIGDVLTEEQQALLIELRADLRSAAADFTAGERRDGPRGASGDRLDRVAREIGLSPQQRAEIRAIIETAAPDVLALASEMAANRSELNAELTAEAVDWARVEDITFAQGTLFGELVVIRAGVVEQLRDVLSEEQLEQIQTLKDALREAIENRFG